VKFRALAVAVAAVTSLGVVLAGSRAAAEPPESGACNSWVVEYALAGSLQLTDTPMGQGDGIYPIGPGTLTVRFDDSGGQPGGAAKLVSYDMHQRVTVTAKALFWKTTVVSDAVTKGALEVCGPDEGKLEGSSLLWTAPVRSFVTEGAMTCTGSFCGSFGAPPPGQSPLHLGPNPVQFKPFQFSADLKTFTMASTFVAATESPKQTSHMALAGREVRRVCEARSCGR
jgi:hypothetical protein